MVVKSRWSSFAFRCLFAAVVAGFGCAALAQSAPAAKGDDKAERKTEPEAVPLAEAARRAEETSTLLGELREEAGEDRTAAEAERELRVLAREIDARLADNRKAIARTASIETLRRIETRWSPLRRNLASLSRRLGARIERLDREAGQIEDMAATWTKTREEAKGQAPAELVRRIDALIAEIARTRETLAAQRSRLLAMQNRVAGQDGRMADALTAARRAREDLEENIFARDGEPIWSAALRARGAQDFAGDARRSLAAQWAAVEAYAERQAPRFLLHAAAFAALTALLYWTRRRVLLWLKDEPRVADIGAVFDAPAATALLVSVLCGFRIYPDAPVLVFVAMGALALVPAVAILRRLIEPGMYPVLYALVAFYVVDQVRLIAAPLQLAPRLILLVEMAAAAAFSAWLLVSGRRARPVQGDPAPGLRSGPILRWAGWLALALALASLLANALGHAGLANLLGGALLSTAYVAITLYALVEIADGLFVMALHLPPFTLLGAVQRHRALLSRRLLRFMQWAAAALLLLFALDRLALRERLFRAGREILTAESNVGAIHVSLGDILAFVLTIWAAFLVSRLVRFLLEEDVYTRFNMRRGTPYAISTMLNYTILIAGFLAAVAALGFDMTKFTILAGAFSIGVGFGLQNVFNNFVSGLILLFERPVKIGDVIQIDDVSGIVEHIGIRASTVRASTGSEIIVPNGKLISERVVNWTFSSHARSIQLPIAVAIGTDLPHVIRVLEQVARDCELVAETPPPKAIVVRMGPDWLGLELHAWTERVDLWMEIRSDLAVAAAAALAEAEIPVR